MTKQVFSPRQQEFGPKTGFGIKTGPRTHFFGQGHKRRSNLEVRSPLFLVCSKKKERLPSNRANRKSIQKCTFSNPVTEGHTDTPKLKHSIVGSLYPIPYNVGGFVPFYGNRLIVKD